MKLTPELKAYIDTRSVYELLYVIRFAPLGDEMMQDESGEYWLKRMSEKRSEDNDAYVAASKEMGW